MDIKKDIQGRGMLSNQASGSMESFTISIGKKGERLATALYLVTSFLSDTEPLKGRLRTLSLDLVRDASSVRYGTTSVETNVLEMVRANIGETLGLLELALIAGLISEMNFSILKREYATLRDAIEIKKASRESRTDTILGDTFFGSSFGTPAFQNSSNLNTHHLPQKDQSHDLSANNPKGHSIGQKETTVSDTKTKGHAPAPRVTAPASVPNSKFNIQNSVQKESRRTRILKLIKDNREVTIKDITTYFPELSEKTIQRELVSLVEANVLKKFGERRWSRYSLA